VVKNAKFSREAFIFFYKADHHLNYFGWWQTLFYFLKVVPREFACFREGFCFAKRGITTREYVSFVVILTATPQKLPTQFIMGHYVYYSFEEGGGRGYIGVRSCKGEPREDGGYLGSFYDPTFKPSGKIIIREYDTAEGATRGEVALHTLFNVGVASHFANLQKSTGVTITGRTWWKNEITQEQRSCYEKPGGEGWEKGVLQKTKDTKHRPSRTGQRRKRKPPLSSIDHQAVIVTKPNGTELGYATGALAAEQLGIHKNTIYFYIMKNESPSWGDYKGWKFRYLLF
jgi:hypothetical protein